MHKLQMGYTLVPITVVFFLGGGSENKKIIKIHPLPFCKRVVL